MNKKYLFGFSKLTWLLFFSFFAYGSTVFAIGPCSTSIRETFQIDRADFSIIFPVYALSYMFASILGGIASEKFGKKMVLMLGLALYGVSLYLFICPSWLIAKPLFAFSIIMMGINGAGGGLIELNVSSLGADINPDREGFVLNAVQVAFGFGAVLSPLVVSLLFSQGIHWQMIYEAGAVFTLLMLLLLGLEDTPKNKNVEEPIAKEGLMAMVGTPTIWVLVLAMVFYIGAEVTLSDWQSDYLEKGLHASRVLASGIPSLFWLGMTVGRVICSILANQISPRRMLIALGALASLSIAVIPFCHSISIAVCSIALTGFFMSGGFAMVLTYASERYTSHNGPVFTFMMAGVGLGNTVFPTLAGFVANQGALQWTMLIPAVLLLGLCLLFVELPHISTARWDAYLERNGVSEKSMEGISR